MTIDDIQAILRSAQSRIGYDGRFALTLTLQPEEECYITHWFRPSPYAFEDCRMVARGTVAECLQALEAYIATYGDARPGDTPDSPAQSRYAAG